MEKKQEIVKLKKEVNSYLQKAILSPTNNFSSVSVEQKLSFLQFTPKWAVKSRAVWKDKSWNNVYAPYVEIKYVEKALNFLSNFNWGSKKIGEQFVEWKTMKWKAKYEASVDYDFYLVLWDTRIEKAITWTAMTYENPATSKFEVIKNARANAIKLFAREFGIWADKDNEYQQIIYWDRLATQKDDWQELERPSELEAELIWKYNKNANI